MVKSRKASTKPAKATAPMPARRNSRSDRCRCLIRAASRACLSAEARGVSSVIGFPVALDDAERDEVEAKGDDEQDHAEGEGGEGGGMVKRALAGEHGDDLVRH